MTSQPNQVLAGSFSKKIIKTKFSARNCKILSILTMKPGSNGWVNFVLKVCNNAFELAL